MASEVDIANLALGHLGDRATVASIDPPEGSAQAEHCQRFYPIARDTLLEMHDWNFATRRMQLAQVESPASSWKYAYTLPGDCLMVRAILPRDAQDDYVTNFYDSNFRSYPVNAFAVTTTAEYIVETLDNGTKIILTNQEEAVVRYIARVADTTRFSALFTMALSWHLASLLAGPVIKGDVGRGESKRCMQMVQGFLSSAKTSDSNQRNEQPTHAVAWMSGR